MLITKVNFSATSWALLHSNPCLLKIYEPTPRLEGLLRRPFLEYQVGLPICGDNQLKASNCSPQTS